MIPAQIDRTFSQPAELINFSDIDYEDFIINPDDGLDVIIIPSRASVVKSPSREEEWRILPGSLLYAPANSSDHMMLCSTVDIIVLFLRREAGKWLQEGAADLGANLPDELTVVTSPVQISAISKIAKRICASGQSENPNCVNAISSLLLTEIAIRRSARSLRIDELSGENLNQIDAFIDKNIEYQLQLADLAEHIGLSAAQFSRAFRNTIGVTPIQYVIEKRINRAKELLSANSTSIAEVAYATGFSSQSHLTDTFKRHVGVTPGSYKRQACYA